MTAVINSRNVFSLQRLGETIKACRFALELSADELGKSLGENAFFVEQLESGNFDPAITVLAQCADSFGIELRELVAMADGEQDLIVMQSE